MTNRKGPRPDFATLVGLVLAVGGIVGGLMLEGGHPGEILAPTALLIVLGGTLGAVMVTTPLSAIRRAAAALKDVFFDHGEPPDALIDKIVALATTARKNGIVSLEDEAGLIADPFLRKALMLAVDGIDLHELRKMMDLEIEIAEQDAESDARVFESAGGYSPTIGIIGAVLGLIQTMKQLADIDKVGHGIATAFVATIYGVGFANVFFLPAGAKIKARSAERVRLLELIVEGVVGIVEGLNPKLIRSKLEAYARTETVKAKPAPPGRAA